MGCIVRHLSVYFLDDVLIVLRRWGYLSETWHLNSLDVSHKSYTQ